MAAERKICFVETGEWVFRLYINSNRDLVLGENGCRFGKSLGILRWNSCMSLGEERSFTDCSSSCPSCPWAVTRCGCSFASCFSGLPGSYLQSLQCPEHQTGHPGASGGISPGPAPRQGTTKVLYCFVTTPTPWDTGRVPSPHATPLRLNDDTALRTLPLRILGT